MEEENHLVTNDPFSNPRQQGTCAKNKRVILIAAGVLIVLAVVIGLIVGLSLRASPSPEGLANAVTTANIMGHLREFYKISQKPGNGGSRSVLGGYMDSLNYVRNKLKSTGCTLSTESFPAPNWAENSQPAITFTIPGTTTPIPMQYGTDFVTMRYGGNGTHSVAATVKTVLNGGCDAADWADVNPGDIGLVRYLPTGATNDCAPYIKATLGVARQASAILVANSVNRTTLAATRILPNTPGFAADTQLVSIPVMVVSYAIGNMMSSYATPVTATIQTNTSIIVSMTQNLYCRTAGDAKNTIVIGAHLDGVPAGPGINDNGSGSATLLEIVLQFYRLKFKPHSRIQFSWWGAEEIGLLGSYAFVNSSKQANAQVPIADIKMAVNFDMLGSPNGVPQLHSIKAPGNPVFPNSSLAGSEAITATFRAAFGTTDPKLDPMYGGSDYYPFIMSGIPAGGLATGAGALKTVEERTKYGGLANAAYDPCYHQACDTVDNIGQPLLGTMAQAASRAIAQFALQTNINSYLAKGDKAM